MAVAVTVTLPEQHRPEQHGRCSDDTCGYSSNASRFDKIDRALEQLSLKIEQHGVELREYIGSLFAQHNERLDTMTVIKFRQVNVDSRFHPKDVGC